MITTRQCATCGTDFTPATHGRQRHYCSNACRQKAFRNLQRDLRAAERARRDVMIFRRVQDILTLAFQQQGVSTTKSKSLGTRLAHKVLLALQDSLPGID